MTKKFFLDSQLSESFNSFEVNKQQTKTHSKAREEGARRQTTETKRGKRERIHGKLKNWT